MLLLVLPFVCSSNACCVSQACIVCDSGPRQIVLDRLKSAYKMCLGPRTTCRRATLLQWFGQVFTLLFRIYRCIRILLSIL